MLWNWVWQNIGSSLWSIFILLLSQSRCKIIDPFLLHYATKLRTGTLDPCLIANHFIPKEITRFRKIFFLVFISVVLIMKKRIGYVLHKLSFGFLERNDVLLCPCLSTFFLCCLSRSLLLFTPLNDNIIFGYFVFAVVCIIFAQGYWNNLFNFENKTLICSNSVCRPYIIPNFKEMILEI